MTDAAQPSARTMQIGVVYPQTELRGDPAAVRRIGKGAEDLGPAEDFGADYVALPKGGVGGVVDLAAEAEAWREAAGTHVSVVTMGLGLDSADGHLDYLASVADALIA